LLKAGNRIERRLLAQYQTSEGGAVKSSALKGLALAVVAAFLSTMSGPRLPASAAEGTTPHEFQAGNVIAGVGNGQVQHYDGTGRLLETLDTGLGGFTTGCAFDAAKNLYVTNFSAGAVSRFAASPPHAKLGTFGSAYSGSPESVVFDATGNAYVGQAGGNGDVLKFDPTGEPINEYDVPIEDRGSDWIDLAKDQRTLYYTSEGKRIFRYNLEDKAALSDFGPELPGSRAYALRILPGGGVLVADSELIVQLDSSGQPNHIYDVQGHDGWFSLNLNPDGKTFWSGDFTTGQLHLFSLDGGPAIRSIDTGVGSSRLFGVCVAGEVTSSLQDSDGDGLPDVWEEKGFDSNGDGKIDVDLPNLGAKKDHQDIFVYVDWLQASGTFGHSHKPDDAAVGKVVAAFAASNITLHVLFGQSIPEDSQNRELGEVISDCHYRWAEFQQLKKRYFPAHNEPVFHYAIFGHDLPSFSCVGGRPSGISRNAEDMHNGASDFIVALGTWENILGGFFLEADRTSVRAGTFMHELGHNLGLGHGGVKLAKENGRDVATGADHLRYKPNHLSVMNYSFQMRGLRKKVGDKYKDGTFDYSRFGSDVLPDLSEDALSEPSGLRAGNAVKDYGTRYYCRGETKVVDGLQQSVDWNCDKDKNDQGLKASINKDDALDNLTSGGNEWAHLILKGGSIGVFGVAADLPDETSMAESPELTFEEDQKIAPYLLPVAIDVKPGQAVNPINLTSRGKIPVAILATVNFDPVATVDTASLTFGRTGDERSLASCNQRGEDINADARLDLVCHFYTNKTSFAVADTTAILRGNLRDGTPIMGSDGIRVTK
jgi:hypothetical protein